MLLTMILGMIRGPLMKVIGRVPDLRDLSLTTSLGDIYSYNPSGIKEVISGMYTRGCAVA
jgi:hypothetical protein